MRTGLCSVQLGKSKCSRGRRVIVTHRGGTTTELLTGVSQCPAKQILKAKLVRPVAHVCDAERVGLDLENTDEEWVRAGVMSFDELAQDALAAKYLH